MLFVNRIIILNPARQSQNIFEKSLVQIKLALLTKKSSLINYLALRIRMFTIEKALQILEDL